MTDPTLSMAARLRAAMAGPAPVQVPGAYDALTARLVAQAGFPAVYMTGFGATVSRLGVPDLGLMTQTEMTGCARDMARACPIPILADADTGYGGVNNIRRTVEEYVQAGVAAIHLEDQTLPKRCGQLGGVTLEEEAAQVRRLKAALAARGGADMLIIARTDALGALGMEAAIARATAYAETGADMLFVDGVKTRAHVETIARALEGAPKMVSLVDGTEAGEITAAEAHGMGFSLIVHPLTTLFAAAEAARRALAALAAEGKASGMGEGLMGYAALSDAVDLHGWEDFDAAWG